MKTIGILGGFGPQATLELEQQLHQFSQQLIPPDHNGGYPPIITIYHRHAPFILKEDFSPVFPLKADPRLLASAKRLGPMVDFIIIPSNGVHLIQKELEEASGRPLLSMIDLTIDEVLKRQWSKIGVVGFMGKPMIYIDRLHQLRLSYETIDDALQERLNSSIMKVMEGKNDAADSAVALEVIRQLRSKNVDGIILGCTELPLLLGKHATEKDLINPSLILAEGAVKYSLTETTFKP